MLAQSVFKGNVGLLFQVSLICAHLFPMAATALNILVSQMEEGETNVSIAMWRWFMIKCLINQWVHHKELNTK